MQFMETDVLRIAFESGGPANGPPVLLLHGWPDDVRGFAQVTPYLENAGYRWAAPYLRGFGGTEFQSRRTVRDGSAVALAQDALDLAEKLGWSRFSVIGHDWGARAAYTIAALAPDRLSALGALALAYSPRGAFPTPSFAQSRRWWYQWFMTTEKGAEAVRRDSKGFARIQWDTWSPPGWFDETEFDATARSFENGDWVAITLHGYRSRWRVESNDERYDKMRQQLARTDQVRVPTVMIQGAADACDPPSESEQQARYFPEGYHRVVLDGVGHFPAREAPEAVAQALVAHLVGSGGGVAG
jgi:pimeloyl-ACP methyl ester carboxylesterase